MIFTQGKKSDHRGAGRRIFQNLLIATLVVSTLFQIFYTIKNLSNFNPTLSSTNGREVASHTWDPKINPLGIPPGQAQNLPSPRLKDSSQTDKRRRNYGGKGDAQHLGGFNGKSDPGGLSPGLFKHMIEVWGVHSFLDIGCGRGFSTSWFYFHGVDVMCAEGSHDAIEQTVLPNPKEQLVEHDFSRGPWWPQKTYDVAWSVEFLEHVGVQFHYNYVTAFRKAALIFVTASAGNGWHHVEVHNQAWWIRKYESYGFKYDEEMTMKAKEIAKANKKKYKGPDDVFLDGFYIRVTLMVFVNPVVASLPEHAHLFPEYGCFGGRKKGADTSMIHRKCDPQKGETAPDPSIYPLEITDKMHEDWVKWIEPRIKK